MIRITPNAPPTPTDPKTVGGQARGDLSDPHRDPFKRRDPRDGGLRGRLGRDGAPGSAGNGLDRSGDFSRRFEAALGEGDARGGARDDDARDERRTRVLAVAEAPADTVAALFAHQPAATDAAAAPVDPAAGPVAPTREEAVATLAARVEQAYRAELSAGDGRPMALTLPLDGLIEGVKDLTVRVTPTGLDVTLTRTFGEAPHDFVAAAQLLASHLQQRFAKRTVRVLEATEPDLPRAAQGSGDALSEIGRLLGHARA